MQRFYASHDHFKKRCNDSFDRRALDAHHTWASGTGRLLFEVLETIENPDVVYLGNSKELLAVKGLSNEKNRCLIVVYKEFEDQSGILIDGFIVTAFSTSRIKSLEKRPIAWQP